MQKAAKGTKSAIKKKKAVRMFDTWSWTESQELVSGTSTRSLQSRGDKSRLREIEGIQSDYTH